MSAGPAGFARLAPTVDHLFGALADARAESFLDDAVGRIARSARKLRPSSLVPRDTARPRRQLPRRRRVPERGSRARGGRGRRAPRADARAPRCATKGLRRRARRRPRTSLVDASPLLRARRRDRGAADRARDAGGARMDLARRGSGWHERAPEERDLGADEVDSANVLAAALAEARALDARRGEAGERLAVKRAPRSSARAARHRGRRGRGAGRGGRRSRAPASTTAPSCAFPARPLGGSSPIRSPFEARAVWRAPFDPGAIVAIDDSCGRVPQRLDLDDGVWTSPAGTPADSLSASNLAEVGRARQGRRAGSAEVDDGDLRIRATRDRAP